MERRHGLKNWTWGFWLPTSYISVFIEIDPYSVCSTENTTGIDSQPYFGGESILIVAETKSGQTFSCFAFFKSEMITNYYNL